MKARANTSGNIIFGYFKESMIIKFLNSCYNLGLFQSFFPWPEGSSMVVQNGSCVLGTL
jgi:hypothetical protein